MKFLKIEGLDFEVAEFDSPYELDMKNAKKYAKDVEGEIPTIDELHQIGELYRAGKLSHLKLADGLYWSSTEHYYSTSRIERFSDGNQYDINKHYAYVVRCVRDERLNHSVIPAEKPDGGETMTENKPTAGDVGEAQSRVLKSMCDTWSNGIVRQEARISAEDFAIFIHAAQEADKLRLELENLNRKIHEMIDAEYEIRKELAASKKGAEGLADVLDMLHSGGPEEGTPYEDWARDMADITLAEHRGGE